MKKKILYFTIELGLYDDDESLNGNKTISVYSFENNKPRAVATIETVRAQSSVEAITDYLEIDLEDYDLVQL